MNSPATVQRYTMTITEMRIGHTPAIGSYADVDGEWVMWEDHCRALEAAQKEVAELRAKVASLEKDAADHCEALTIMHGIGYNSRNDEVRALQAERDEARGLLLESKEAIGQIAMAPIDFGQQTDAIAQGLRVADRIDAFLGTSP